MSSARRWFRSGKGFLRVATGAGSRARPELQLERWRQCVPSACACNQRSWCHGSREKKRRQEGVALSLASKKKVGVSHSLPSREKKNLLSSPFNARCTTLLHRKTSFQTHFAVPQTGFFGPAHTSLLCSRIEADVANPSRNSQRKKKASHSLRERAIESKPPPPQNSFSAARRLSSFFKKKK